MFKISSFLLCLVFFASCSKKSSLNTGKDKFADSRAIYSQYCSSCHGEKVEAFVDRQWKHGNTKEEIITSIKDGYLDAGMPIWRSTIQPDDIEKLADLILNSLSTVNQYDFAEVEKTDTYKSKGITVKLEPVLEGLESPWGMATLPDGALLVTDRKGDLWKVGADKSKVKISGIPEVLSVGQGGLFEVLLHPKYEENGWIYLSYAKSKKENGRVMSTTALVRGKLEGNTFAQKEEIFEALPYFPTRHHYGARMLFDNEGYLFLTVGERGMEKINPQSLESDCGKIHRFYDDGSIPEDNPFYNTPNAKKSIWSFGHRNPQGLVIDRVNNIIWETEHGPRGGDELNIIRKGDNYGWPVISYGINYNGTTFTDLTEKEGMDQPELYWIPSIAPCGMTLVTSDKYPAWQGDILAGSLRFKYVNKVAIKEGAPDGEEKLLINVGRLRNVVQAADGYIYVGIEDPGTVYRLLPQ
jgi:glucose/arabinose dehydrogenase